MAGKSIMEMADEILASDFKGVADTASAYQEKDLPSITDEQRVGILNESMSVTEGIIPVDPAARAQNTARGMSLNTLGRNKPKKTMGTPPGFEKTPKEKAAAKKAENASLYPRITLKGESREYRGRDAAGRVKDVEGNVSSRSGTPSTSASREAGAAEFAKRDAKRKAERTATMKATNQSNREMRARRRSSVSHGPVVPDKPDSRTAQNSSLTRKQYAVLKEALSILKEASTSGGIGVSMAGSANKAYDADAKPMGKDNVPIVDVDKSLKKVKKGGKKKASKKKAKKKKEDVKAESFDAFLDKVLNDAKEGF